MSVATDRFELARKNEALLNGRQREVLDLLVAGKTNGEIADSLGMTLDGAKWNVSEILGKLGLASREEAAEYWQQRRSRRNPVGALRGLLGVGALKWGAAAAGVAVVSIVFLGLFSKDDTDKSGDLPPFYLEAQMHMIDNSIAIGTNIAGSQGNGPPPIERRSEIRWWFRDIDHMRVEIETFEPAEEAGTDIILMGDGKQTYYDFQTNTYTETPLFEFPEEAIGKVRFRPWSFGTFIGPWIQEAEDLDEIIAQLKEFGSSSEPRPTAAVVGRDRLLGREVDILEYAPASSSTDSAGNVTGKGHIRYWIDPERLVILKQAVEGNGDQTYSIEVSKLDWDTKVDGDRFRFDPPKGAERVDDNSAGALADHPGGGSTGVLGDGINFETPAAMLKAKSVPDGFRAVSALEEHDSADRPISLEVEYAHEDGRKFVIEQRIRAGGPGFPLPGREVALGGRTVFVAERGDETVVQWADGDLVVRIASATVTEQELLAVAESLEAQP